MRFDRRSLLATSLAFATLLGVQSAEAWIHGKAPATYYFDPVSGSDAGAGTIASPWQTMAKANATVLFPGDTIAFIGGKTNSGTFTLNYSGTFGNPITITSYGVGNATIAVTSASGIVLTNPSYVTISNLTMTGSGTGAAYDGIQVNVTASCTDLTISGCQCSGFAHCGIYVNALTGGATRALPNLTISNCVCNNNASGVFNGGSGIFVRAANGSQNTGLYRYTNALITGCSATRNDGAAGTSSWCGSGIMLSSCNGGLIVNCTADNNGRNCNNTGGPGGIWTADSIGVVIRACTSINNKTAGADGVGFDIDGGCTNCVIEYCFASNNVGAGYLNFMYDDPTNITSNSGNIIRFNISVLDGGGGFRVVSGGTSPNSGLVYGNTVYTASGVACVLYERQGAALTQKFYGNIFATAGSRVITTGSNAPFLDTFTGNDYYGVGGFQVVWAGTTYNSYAAWQTATNQEKISGSNVGLNVDPGLVSLGSSLASGYKITGGSAILNNGINLLSNFGIDVGVRDYFSAAISSAGPYTPGASWVP